MQSMQKPQNYNWYSLQFTAQISQTEMSFVKQILMEHYGMWDFTQNFVEVTVNIKALVVHTELIPNERFRWLHKNCLQYHYMHNTKQLHMNCRNVWFIFSPNCEELIEFSYMFVSMHKFHMFTTNGNQTLEKKKMWQFVDCKKI